MQVITATCLAAVANSISPTVYAGIEPVIYVVTTASGPTVPAGKVLMIDNVFGYSLLQDMLTISKGGTSTSLEGYYFSSRNRTDTDRNTVAYPLLIPEGWSLRAVGSGFTIFGRLVDLTDLYAGVSHRIESISIGREVASLGIQMPSAKPVHITAEATADPAQGWRTVTNAVVTRSADPTRLAVTLAADEAKQFYRTKTTPRH
jgi:hypothetical protein